LNDFSLYLKTATEDAFTKSVGKEFQQSMHLELKEFSSDLLIPLGLTILKGWPRVGY
jgi:hypothetical protein